MKDEKKTRKQLLDELIEIRQHVAELESTEAQCKQTQEGLQQRVPELDMVFASLPTPVVIHDAIGLPVQANPAAVRAYGFNPVGVELETFIRRLSLRHPTGRPVTVEELPSSRALCGETVIGDPFFFTNAEPRDFAILASASPLVNGDKVAGAVTVCTDVTEHERLHEQLRQLNEELDTARLKAMKEAEEARRRASERGMIIESIAEGVFVCNKEGQIIEVNEAGLKLIGLARKEEILGPLARYLSLLNLRHLNGRPMATEELPLSQALRGETVLHYEATARSLRTQQDIYLLMSTAPVRDHEGNIIGAVAVTDDITQIRELDKLKDEFLSVAAHELKTPVAIMKGYAELLLRTIPNLPPQSSKMLDAIDRGAGRIDSIIKDLLDISRLHLGYLEFTVETIDLPTLVEQAVNQMALTTTRHRIQVVRADPAVVRGDQIRLQEVLDNLIDNAIKYSPQGGGIDIEIVVRDREAVVSIRDCGIGIPKEKQAHIFEHFYRAHTGTPYDYGGMGVGLYISRELILRQGGRMWFESKEDKGSTFYFSLPLAEALPEAREVAPN